MVDRKLTPQEIEQLPYSQEVELQPAKNCVVVNGSIGIGFKDEERIDIVCAQRIPVVKTPIVRKHTRSKPQNKKPAEYVLRTYSLWQETTLYIGDNSPLVIERVSDISSTPIIKISHTRAISVQAKNTPSLQLLRQLRASQQQ